MENDRPGYEDWRKIDLEGMVADISFFFHEQYLELSGGKSESFLQKGENATSYGSEGPLLRIFFVFMAKVWIWIGTGCGGLPEMAESPLES